MVNSITLFALAILLVRNVWSLCANVTTIEGWEIERHETLLRRARTSGGFLDGPDGISVKISEQQFPYDIGVIQNILQGMGRNALTWLWPFARTPSVEDGFYFEVNGFEDPSTSWPPPDPDRVPRRMKRPEPNQMFTQEQDQVSSQEHLEAFRQRQQVDLQRFRKELTPIVRRRPFYQRHDNTESIGEEQNPGLVRTDDFIQGEEAWRDHDGDRLDDFGVDEYVDFYDEDDVPLAVLLQQRGRRKSTSAG
ncbi:Palmitoyltransferase [Pseudocyphellaria aurata]|nr:Palmitoyltransferase [Pseudocyphellaria aurata]